MFNKKSKAFTLIEILLYFGLFFLIIGIVYPILSESLKNYLILSGVLNLQQEMRNIFLRIQREVIKSNSMNILTDWEIVFGQKNEQIAFFQTHPIYLEGNNLKGYVSNLSIGSISLNGNNYGVNLIPSTTCFISSNTSTPATSSFSGYAWSPNLGWFKFRNTDSGEPVYGVCLDSNNELRGYAWNDVVGYISFNCLDLNVCSTSNYKVVFKDNYFYGYAWNEVLGWLIFDGKGGKVYIAKLKPHLYSLDLISDPRINVQELKFSQVDNSLKVDLKMKAPGETYEEGDTVIILPFK